MAGPYYVRSSDGDDASDGLSWANAKATLTGALAVAVAGERIWVSQAHSELTAGTITLTASGSTPASPIEILCGNDAAEPPTALAATAVAATSGNVAFNIGGGFAYWYGIQFKGSTGSGSLSSLNVGSSTNPAGHVFDACTFHLQGTNVSVRIRLGTAAGGSNDDFSLEFRGCSFTFGATAQAIELRYGRITLIDCVIPSGGSVPSTLFETETSLQSAVRGSGIDFSAASGNLVSQNGDGPTDILFANIKTHASAVLVTGTHPGPGGPIVRVHNYGSGDTNYRFYECSYQGTTQDETTIVRTGGASDGTTPLAWKMVSTANARFHDPLYSPEIVLWNDSTGGNLTFTVEVVTDNVTLTNGEAWLEVEYLGTSGFPLSIHGSDRKANILTTAANQDSSSETWTTTGLTTPVKQKFVSAALTIHEKGPVRVRVALAKASTTMYVCPKVTVA